MNDAMVLRPMRFLGHDRLPGDIIPGSELAKVNPSVLDANFSLGNLGEPEKHQDTLLDEARVRQMLAEFAEQQRTEMHEIGVQVANSLRDSLVENVVQAIRDGELVKTPRSTRNTSGRRRRATAGKEGD